MSKFVSVFVAPLATAAFAAPVFAQPTGHRHEAASPVAGSIACHAADAGACRIAWALPADSQRTFWLEEMRPDTGQWQRVADSPTTHSGITDQPLPGGRLYRAVGCTGQTADASTCVGSDVVWAIVHPKNADAIPAIVYTDAGVPMYVGKSLGFKEQVQQYNVYLVSRLLDTLGEDELNSLPPMASPRFGPEVPVDVLLAHASDDEIIEHIVFRQYEVTRTGQLLPYTEHTHTR